MLKTWKKAVSLVLVFAMSMMVCVPAFAAENRTIHNLIPSPPSSNTGIIVQGAYPPNNNDSIHDVSISDYNYQVKDVGYRVFTDKWLTGISSIDISVKNWKLNDYYGGTSNELTLTVYDSNGNDVDQETITITGNSGSCTLGGMSPSSKYYVEFRVPTNSNRYSFNGSISESD